MKDKHQNVNTSMQDLFYLQFLCLSLTSKSKINKFQERTNRHLNK